MTDRQRRRYGMAARAGLSSAVGGWIGVALALLWDVDLPLGLVFGAALGGVIFVVLESIGRRVDDSEIKEP